MQKHTLPSLFPTKTTGEANGLCEGLITPMSNISHMCTLTSSYITGRMHLYLSLEDVLSFTFILCLTSEVFLSLNHVH